MSNLNRRGTIGWLIDSFRADYHSGSSAECCCPSAVSFMTLALVVCLLIRCANQT